VGHRAAGQGGRAARSASVEVQNRQRRVRVSPERLRALARRALRALHGRHRELSVVTVGDAEMRRLNARYHGHRTATDVLAFDLGATPTHRLAEVIISADTAARQARRAGVPVALEIDLLLVHGLLHLAGFDDRDPIEARRMHERARAILTRAGRTPVPGRLWRGLLPTA
jgi:probable rRNA maturation factor